MKEMTLLNIKMACPKCIEEKRELEEVIFEINDQGEYSIECPFNHTTKVFLENHKYEVLFDMGIAAFHDGYLREAVSNFAAALERFYEFCIQVMLKKRAISEEEFQKTWKPMNKYSERQLGAFLVLYLSEFEIAPLIFNEKLITIRNDVTHKGKFVSYAECLKYAKGVFDYIHQVLLIIKGKLDYEIISISEDKMLNYAMDEECNEELIMLWSLDTVFRSVRPIEEIELINFDKEIEVRKTYKIFSK